METVRLNNGYVGKYDPKIANWLIKSGRGKSVKGAGKKGAEKGNEDPK